MSRSTEEKDKGSAKSAMASRTRASMQQLHAGSTDGDVTLGMLCKKDCRLQENFEYGALVPAYGTPSIGSDRGSASNSRRIPCSAAWVAADVSRFRV